MDFNDTPDNDPSSVFVPMARPVGMVVAAPGPQTHPMELLDDPAARSWWDILTLILLVVGLEFVMVFTSKVLTLPEASGDSRLINIFLVMIRGGLLLAIIGIILRNRRQKIASIGWCSQRWWMTGLFGLAGAAAAFVGLSAVIGLMYLVFPSGYAAMQRNPERIIEEIPKLHPLILCLIALFVGIYEEIIFRGFLLTRLRRATGSAVLAVVVSAVLFAAPHAATQETVAVVPILMLGLVWAILTLWRRSVIPAVIAHALFDSLQFMSLYYFYPQWE